MKTRYVLLLGVILFAGWTHLSEQWRYFSRAITYPDNPITNFAWYDTKIEIAGQESKPLETSTSSPAISERAIQAAKAYVHQTPKSSLLILHRGKVVHESYPSGQSSELRTNSMSMAKSIIGLLIGIAIDEKKIRSVDDKVSDYLADWKTDRRREISLRHLLTMSSGLRCDDDTSDYTSDLLRLHLGTEIKTLTHDLPYAEKPGTKYQYNNFNTQVLAMILEKVTGKSLGQYLSAKLWRPLGAKTAYLWQDKSDGTERAYCCFFARARDYARVGQMILNKGVFDGQRIVSEQWLDMMGQASTHEPEYGLHLWRASRNALHRMKNRTEEFLDETMVYLDGKHRQRVYILPKYGLVIVRAGEHPQEWNDAFLPNTLVRGLTKTSTLPSGERP